MEYLISQLLFAVGYAMLIISYFAKNKTRTFIYVVVFSFITLAAYIVAGSASIIPFAIVAIVRSLVFFITAKLCYNKVWVLLALCVLYVATTIFWFQDWSSIMFAVTNIVYMIGCYQKRKDVLMLCNLVLSASVILYNVLQNNIVAYVMESVFVVMVLIVYFIDCKKKKNGTYQGY